MTTRRTLPSFRLIDGVIVAAVALLGLKALGLLAYGPPMAVPVPPPTETKRVSAAEFPSFGRIFAHARTNEETHDPETTGSVPAKQEEAPQPKEPPSAPPPREEAPPLIAPSASERLLLERLGERREELQQRSREMEARERMLQEQERRLDDRMGQIKAAEDTQKAATATKASNDPAPLKNVVVMYETMKPKEAARVFDRLPIDVLLSVVTQMNSRKMAEILAVMAPENAEKLTVALAKRANGGETAMQAPADALPAGELPAIARRPAPRR